MIAKNIADLFKAAAVSWVHDYAQSMGAALAFYTIFSIAPLLLIVTSIAGLVFGADAVHRGIFTWLQGLLGSPGATAVQSLLDSAADTSARSAIAPVFGLIVLFMGATSVFAEWRDALDRIWRAPVRPKSAGLWRLLRARLLSLGMILGKVQAFTAFGGLARTLMYDNLKSVVLATCHAGGASIAKKVPGLFLRATPLTVLFL